MKIKHIDGLVSALEEINNKLTENQPVDLTEILNSLGNKVDKIHGKGLSTNDFTNEYKNKLDNCNPVCIDTNGNASIPGNFTANNFVLSSDICEFVFKSDSKKRKRYGVIAQHIEDKHPEFVHTDKDGFKTVAYIELLLAKIANLEKRIYDLEKKQ